MSEQDDELLTACLHIGELLDRNRFAQAKRVLDDALPRFPESTELLYYAAHIAWRMNRLDEAVGFLDQVLAFEPQHYMGRIIRADIHEKRDELADSERLYLDILRERPEDADVLAYYAMLMLRTSHVDKAAALATESLRLEPDNPTGLQVTTLTSIIKGDSQSRDERLAEMINKHPELESTSGLLVQVLLRDGRYDEAARLARQMLHANPQNEHLLELVMETRRASHWSMWLLRPFMRFGWGASAAAWFAFVIISQTLSGAAAKVFITVFLIYVVYSWLWPPILKRLLAR